MLPLNPRTLHLPCLPPGIGGASRMDPPKAPLQAPQWNFDLYLHAPAVYLDIYTCSRAAQLRTCHPAAGRAAQLRTDGTGHTL